MALLISLYASNEGLKIKKRIFKFFATKIDVIGHRSNRDSSYCAAIRSSIQPRTINFVLQI